MSFITKLPAQADFKKVLLERYQEAVARSRKIGHRVSFRVEVDPAAGAQTITPVEEQPIASENAFPVEDTGKPNAELEAALGAARERGRKRVAEIVAGDDMLSADAFAKLLGTSRVTVNAKRQNGQVLGINGTKRGFRFPVWQLDTDGRPFAALPALHETFGNNAWAAYRFLISPMVRLNSGPVFEPFSRAMMPRCWLRRKVWPGATSTECPAFHLHPISRAQSSKSRRYRWGGHSVGFTVAPIPIRWDAGRRQAGSAILGVVPLPIVLACSIWVNP
jgi:uncharacterized protein YggU (UPF0235/DUF167 family)